MAGHPVDREMLHRLLWSRTDHRGVVSILQKQLALDLGISKFTMCRIMAELTEAGIVHKIGASEGNIGRYSIAEPAS